jgi:hypothetical protein
VKSILCALEKRFWLVSIAFSGNREHIDQITTVATAQFSRFHFFASTHSTPLIAVVWCQKAALLWSTPKQDEKPSPQSNSSELFFELSVVANLVPLFIRS